MVGVNVRLLLSILFSEQIFDARKKKRPSIYVNYFQRSISSEALSDHICVLYLALLWP